MNDWLIAAGYIVAWLLGIWVGWYGLRPPQLRWPWHYSEADAYTKKYCSDELALASEQARESEGRTMGDKTEARPVGPRNLTWQEAEELKWKGRIADKANELEHRVTALEERTGMLEEIENQIHSINPPLRGLSSPDSSPDTETQADPQSLSNTLSPSLSVKVDGR